MEDYSTMTHEELVQEVYALMRKLPLEKQAALAEKVRKAAALTDGAAPHSNEE